MKYIDYEVEPKRDLDGGGSATRQNTEQPSLWQRIINWLKELFRI